MIYPQVTFENILYSVLFNLIENNQILPKYLTS